MIGIAMFVSFLVGAMFGLFVGLMPTQAREEMRPRTPPPPPPKKT